MDDCIEVLVPNRRQDFETHSLKLDLPRTHIMRATVDRYLMAAGNKSSRQMFGERFKSAIVGRNASRTKDCDAHRTSWRIKPLHEITKHSISRELINHKR